MTSASILLAISGMLAATEPPSRAGAGIAAVEISFVTHVGEGAEGQKRFTRDGCYQAESGGSTGGAGYARACVLFLAIRQEILVMPKPSRLRHDHSGSGNRG